MTVLDLEKSILTRIISEFIFLMFQGFLNLKLCLKRLKLCLEYLNVVSPSKQAFPANQVSIRSEYLLVQ